MGADPAGVLDGGSRTVATVVSQPGAQAGEGSFLFELSLLEGEAMAPALTPTGSVTDDLWPSMEDDDGQGEACATAAQESEVQAGNLEGAEGGSISPGAPAATEAAGCSAPCPPASSTPEAVKAVPLGTSWTWRYFRLPEGVSSAREATTVVCVLCGALVKRGRPGKSGMGTSALASHLAHRHKISKGQGPDPPRSTAATPAAAADTTAAATTATTTTPAAVHPAAATAAATASRRQRPPTTSGARHRHRAGRPRDTSTPRDDATVSDQLVLPADTIGYFAGSIQVCLHCGEHMACGEMSLEAVVRQVKRHIKRYHPEMAKTYAGYDRRAQGRGGEKRGRARRDKDNANSDSGDEEDGGTVA